MLFPSSPEPEPTTRIVIDDPADSTGRLPVVRWAGVGDAGLDGDGLLALLGPGRGTALLTEHAHEWFGRPGLRGHRLTGSGAGRAWTTAFVPVQHAQTADTLSIEARDDRCELVLRTEVESLSGGALRARHTLLNAGETPYVLEGLEVSLPLPDTATEILDTTGRHERERSPQRHALTDGLWLRESRRGRPGLDSATFLAVGAPGFDFGSGELLLAAVAGSGNSVLAVQRHEDAGASLSGGELLLPGEVVLAPDESYETPWVVFVAADGLDAAAHALHTWQRTLPAHPDTQPVTLNVWEAVYFDHDAERLRTLADLAARVGVERFVLDDGWFLGRRDDTAGLGDWWIDETVWPQGLIGLADHVHSHGMEFGLWFEPEMVNPDSRLFREHPDWILSAAGRAPVLHRHQQVLDLTHPQAWTFIRDRVDAVLSESGVDYVKWDHNRDLLEAGSSAHAGAPAVHAQTAAFHALLHDLRARHPQVAWESCASGGGRIDLAVIEQVQRFWTSDMTDALSRQQIQRWTTQLVAPEYLGAHVSAPTSHQTGRTLSLDFRAATAFCLGFGIEWDLTAADEDDLERLATWCALHREHRELLHTGRVVRLDLADPTVLAHGVVSADRTRAVLCHVQLDESAHNRGVTLRLPGLDPETSYDVSWLGPTDQRAVSKSDPLLDHGPTGGAPVTGRQLADVGVWLPRRRPETAQLMLVTAG